MKIIVSLFAFICLLQVEMHAQNTTLGVDSSKITKDSIIMTIVGEDTLIGPPITFRKYNERFVDLMFFDGNYNIVSFHIAEGSTSFQLMLSSLDSGTYCFSVSPDEFKMLMAYMKQFDDELLSQPNYPVKCNYCQTIQVFWYDGDKEKSTLKRSYRIPQVFPEILDFCYDLSDDKRRCKISLDNFMSLEGFEDNLRGPASQK